MLCVLGAPLKCLKYGLTITFSHFLHYQILRSSIEKTTRGVGAEEQRFHDAIMNTIAEFAKNLPDAQKIEILKFILNFDPLPR